MATFDELVSAICYMVDNSPIGTPVTFANHDVEEAAAIIGAVIERCFAKNLRLKSVVIGPELADELGLVEGSVLPHGDRPTIELEVDLGRQIRFIRT